MMLNTTLNSVPPYLKHQMSHVRQFIKSPRTFGSLPPSVPWLCQRMAEIANWTLVYTVAEPGAGDSVLTRSLLARLVQDGHLDACEIRPTLVEKLQAIAVQEPRIKVINHSVAQLDRHYNDFLLPSAIVDSRHATDTYHAPVQ